MRDLIHDVNY